MTKDQAIHLVGGMLKQEEKKIRDEWTGEKQIEQIKLAQSFAEKVLEVVSQEKKIAQKCREEKEKCEKRSAEDK